MDVVLVIVALALIWRGPELAKLLDALWSEWQRRDEPLDVMIYGKGGKLVGFTDARAEHADELDDLDDDSERRARRRAYLAGRGMRVKK